jgi:hypothetical protein
MANVRLIASGDYEFVWTTAEELQQPRIAVLLHRLKNNASVFFADFEFIARGKAALLPQFRRKYDPAFGAQSRFHGEALPY